MLHLGHFDSGSSRSDLTSDTTQGEQTMWPHGISAKVDSFLLHILQRQRSFQCRALENHWHKKYSAAKSGISPIMLWIKFVASAKSNREAERYVEISFTHHLSISDLWNKSRCWVSSHPCFSMSFKKGRAILAHESMSKLGGLWMKKGPRHCSRARKYCFPTDPPKCCK